MKSVNVALKTNAYKIQIGKNTLSQLGTSLKRLKLGKNAIVVTTPVIHKLHGRKLVSGLKRKGFNVKVFTVPDGERSKSARVAIKLLEDIARYDAMKNSFIIAFGGGVIGDLAGYVAAVYKRGVPYVQVPTTFLAQIDSAIGGKTAIDLSVGKNLVGAFYQPKLVFSDVDLLKTLSRRQIRNGLAEAIKYGVIADPQLFQYISKNSARLLKADTSCLWGIVLRCSRIKTKVVVADEFETKGIRSILNFGHTLGHAIEAAGDFKQYHHGEAIALGMRAATDISVQRKILSKANAAKINQLLDDVKLPQKIKKLSTSRILKLMQHDKKFRHGQNRFVLATKVGKVKVVSGVSSTQINKAIKKLR